jgi:hypothetical protein
MDATMIPQQPSWFDLPEDIQRQIFTQIAQVAPQGFEQVPGNYNVIDGKFLNPMEQHSYIENNADRPAAERALSVGPALTGKFSPPDSNSPGYKPGSSISRAGALPTPRPPSIDTLNTAIDVPSPVSDHSYDGEADSMIAQLQKATNLHAQEQ